MRDVIVGLVQASAKSAGERELAAGGDQLAVARTVMTDARRHFMAPDESEAFAGAVAALWTLYPDDQRLRDETKAIGDRNKVLRALADGVPVDFEALDIQPFPADALGLLSVWADTEDVRL